MSAKRRNLDAAPTPFDRLNEQAPPAAPSRPIIDDVPGVTSQQIAGRGQDGATPAPEQGQDNTRVALVKAKPHAVNIRLPMSVWNRVAAVISTKRGGAISLNSAIAEAVTEWLARHEDKKPGQSAG